MSDLSDSIEENAAAPKKMSVDGTSVEQHPLKDQIEADGYLKSQAASRSARRGMVLTKMSPPGTR